MLRLLAVLFVACATWLPLPAQACGGLFCSQAAPVQQSAERIVFVDNGDGTVTAVIEIVYTGPSSSFSWVLPVSGVPTIAVGSTTLLTTLAARTRPSLVATTTGSGCSIDDGCSGCGACESFDTSGFTGSTGTWDAGVAVLGEGTAGPYDYVVISVDPMAPSQADTARTWLTSNGYDVTDAGATVLGDYLAGGQNLVAFRLTKNATTGSIRPIVMTYSSTVGVIPIRPTAVAAVNDMGVLVFLFGASRAVPVSYDEIELSDTAIDWTQPGTSYPAALTAAFDSVGGHAFITERASQTAPIDLNASAIRAALTALADDASLDGWRLVRQAITRFSSAEGFVDALVDGVPGTTSPTATTWATCLGGCLPASTGAPVGFDRAAFLSAIDEFVVAPVELSEELANRRPYLTRLYTTLDPAEMTVDPVFAFATGLPDVSGTRSVTRRVTCRDDRSVIAELELDDGTSYDPARLSESTPIVRRRLDYDLDGTFTVVTDDTATIAAAITDARPRSSDGCATGWDARRTPLLVNGFYFAVFLAALRAVRRTRR